MALVKQAFSDANFSFMEETIYEDEVETGVIVCNTCKRTAEDQQGRLAGHLTAEGSSLDLKKSHCALKRVSKSTTAVSGVHAAATIKQESSGFVAQDGMFLCTRHSSPLLCYPSELCRHRLTME